MTDEVVSRTFGPIEGFQIPILDVFPCDIGDLLQECSCPIDGQKVFIRRSMFRLIHCETRIADPDLETIRENFDFLYVSDHNSHFHIGNRRASLRS